MTRRVAVLPHTHWDREWYRSFQSFRADLVTMLDELLPRLEADPSLGHFMLDGQMAVVDDYLQIRPDAEPLIARLAAAGRISLGPWYILMDEFLVSGETIVRNLALGLDRATRFGGAMRVGYLPDMFGHIAQMPQILRQFGFDHAVVWRGTPAAIDRSGFWWSAPDGSTVRAEYLPQGYGNGARLPDDHKDLVERIRDFHLTHADLLADSPILWMNGSDHQTPAGALATVVAEANASQDDYQLVVTSLAEHLATVPTDDLPAWTGELRSGSRANLLMGVASNRTDVRQAAARAERQLERVAEPMAAMAAIATGNPWPGAFVDLAWRAMILNSAHDSICACSVDDVCNNVLVRYCEATDIADSVVVSSLAAIARACPTDEAVVVNPSARARNGLVELDLPGAVVGDGIQVLGRREAVELVHTVTRADAPTVVERELDIHWGATGVQISLDDDGSVDVTVYVDPTDRRLPPFGWVTRELRRLAAEAPTGVVRVWLDAPATQRVLAWVDEVPGLGWTQWQPAVPRSGPVEVGVDLRSLTNGLTTVEVAADGTLTVNGLEGVGRLVDDGDEGDTYNYSPPAHQQVIDTPETVTVTMVESGPLRGRLEVVRTYRWPTAIVDGHRVGEAEVEVLTKVEVRAGSPLVHLITELDNQGRDHRLRAWIPLPELASYSVAECAFGTVTRGLTSEGGETERAMATFPSRRFVQAGGVALIHEGLPEYELVDVDPQTSCARAVALTLLRCTGWLSRGPMAYRPLPAGPVVETPGAQMQGRQVLRWAVHVARPGDAPPDPYALVDDAFLPMSVTRGTGTNGGEPEPAATRSCLEIDGAEVSAVLARGPRVEVRVFNPGDDPTTVTIAGRSGWVGDLAGATIERFEGSLELAPRRIATLSLDPI